MSVIEMLHHALESHGVEHYVADEYVCVWVGEGEGDLILQPLVFEGPPNNGTTAVQLDIAASSPRIDPRFIIESTAGFGPDRAAAERDAFGKFLLGSFHVLLTALADHSCESNPAEWLQWGSGSASWAVCEGRLLLAQGVQPEPTPTPYPEFYERLQQAFLATASREVHWVRVFLASHRRELIGAEVLLDNEPWAEGVALLTGQDWDCPDEFRSLRHFFIAFPDAG